VNATPRQWAVTALLVLLILAAIFYTRISGWDWAADTSTHYCGVYLPHWDFYCQNGR
jgi:hypothetical protein